MSETKLASVVVLALASAACEGIVGSPPGAEPDPAAGSDPLPMTPPADLPECAGESWSVYEGLAPHCSGCHGDGANMPFMASFSAFSALLLADSRFVVPGDPEGSRLIALLEGRAEGSLSQMPIGASSYAELDAAGATALDMDEIREWVMNLQPCAYDGAEPPPLARRLRTHQIWAALERLLGLSRDDYLRRPPYASYPLFPPDEVDEPGRPDTRFSSHQRWLAMGGEDRLAATEASEEIMPAMIQHVVAMSQVWCRLAVGKPGNTVLFRHGSAEVGTDDPETVRANIRYLFLHLLGVEATDDEVETLYHEVFAFYEARQSSALGWVGVCAALLRDPLFLTY
jgi:mono/diheme cytochrome c family protein